MTALKDWTFALMSDSEEELKIALWGKVNNSHLLLFSLSWGISRHQINHGCVIDPMEA